MPGGNLHKFKIALNYGADAVYIAGQSYGLRAGADNFLHQEILEATNFAHARGKKVYIVLNAFMHDEDLATLKDFVLFLEEVGIDAAIVSDLGAMGVLQENSQIPIHLSTQASCLNSFSANFWRKQGVSRLVLGREVSLQEAKRIKEASGLEIEMFVHGSMCMAYSGHCTISNYTQGRDSNRGGCAHSCRFGYSWDEDQTQTPLYLMSSKDLKGLELLHEYQQAGVDSIKVEGRMKGPFYAALVSSVYSRALKLLGAKDTSAQEWDDLAQELESVGHRGYTAASLQEKAGAESVEMRNPEEKERNYLGEIIGVNEASMFMAVKNPIKREDQGYGIFFNGQKFNLSFSQMQRLDDGFVKVAHPNTTIRLPKVEGVETHNIIYNAS